VEDVLRNHAAGIGAMDFLVVLTINFRLLSVLVILRHERRRLISLSRSPDGGVDRPADHRGLPMGRGAYRFHSRPRRPLRSCRQAADGNNGHPGSPDCAAVTLAEWPC
jgi:hypothetical protein